MELLPRVISVIFVCEPGYQVGVLHKWNCFIESSVNEETGKTTFKIITKLTAVPEEHETINGLD